MIWQLMKRDRMWKGATAGAGGLFVVLAAAAKFLPALDGLHRHALRTGLGAAPIGSIGFMLVLAFGVQGLNARYQAALPITGRDVWLSQVLSLLALIWLPMSIAIAVGFPRLPLLQVAALYTLLVLAAKCVGIRAPGTPPWLRAAGCQVVVLGMILGPLVAPFVVKRLKSASWFVLPPAGSVVTICALASATLFWWGLTTVPKSFQIVSPESGLIRQTETREPSRFTWAPVFRSIYGRPTMLLTAFLVGNVFLGKLPVAGLLLGLTQVHIRGQCRWLLALPISPRRLFGWIALPQTAALLAACLASISLSPAARVLEIAAELAFLYGLIFLSELSAWRRLSKLRAIRWGVRILWMPFVIWSFAPILVLPDTSAIQRLAGVLPGTWWQLALILAIPVIAAYWLAEKAFREQEYRQLRV